MKQVKKKKRKWVGTINQEGERKEKKKNERKNKILETHQSFDNNTLSIIENIR